MNRITRRAPPSHEPIYSTRQVHARAAIICPCLTEGRPGLRKKEGRGKNGEKGGRGKMLPLSRIQMSNSCSVDAAAFALLPSATISSMSFLQTVCDKAWVPWRSRNRSWWCRLRMHLIRSTVTSCNAPTRGGGLCGCVCDVSGGVRKRESEKERKRE